MEQYQWRTYSNIWHVYNYLICACFCYYYRDYNYNYFIFLLYVRRPNRESCLTFDHKQQEEEKGKEWSITESFAFQKKKITIENVKLTFLILFLCDQQPGLNIFFKENMNQFLPSQNQEVQVHVFK